MKGDATMEDDYKNLEQEFTHKKSATLQEIKDILSKTWHKIEWDPDKIIDSIYHADKDDFGYAQVVISENSFFFFITCGLHDLPLPDKLSDLTPELFFMYKGVPIRVSDSPFTVEDLWDTIKKADGMKGTRRLNKFPLLKRQVVKLQKILDYDNLLEIINNKNDEIVQEYPSKFSKMENRDSFKKMKELIFGDSDSRDNER